MILRQLNPKADIELQRRPVVLGRCTASGTTRHFQHAESDIQPPPAAMISTNPLKFEVASWQSPGGRLTACRKWCSSAPRQGADRASWVRRYRLQTSTLQLKSSFARLF